MVFRVAGALSVASQSTGTNRSSPAGSSHGHSAHFPGQCHSTGKLVGSPLPPPCSYQNGAGNSGREIQPVQDHHPGRVMWFAGTPQNLVWLVGRGSSGLLGPNQEHVRPKFASLSLCGRLHRRVHEGQPIGIQFSPDNRDVEHLTRTRVCWRGHGKEVAELDERFVPVVIGPTERGDPPSGQRTMPAHDRL
jgi:hypothetical protein